jgi:hypothetical protein
MLTRRAFLLSASALALAAVPGGVAEFHFKVPLGKGADRLVISSHPITGSPHLIPAQYSVPGYHVYDTAPGWNL